MRLSYQEEKIVLNNVPYGSDESQRFDMLCKGNDVHAVVFIHGGAYFTGNKDQYPSFLLDYSENYLFASINYRVINADNSVSMESIICDVDSALNTLNAISKENGIGIKDFILVGHSAGGQIALLYGYKYHPLNEKIKIAACISMAGPTDFTDDLAWSSMSMWGNDTQERLSFLSLMGSRLAGCPIELRQPDYTKQPDYSNFKKHILEISPVAHVSKEGKTPPTLLVHARGDNQVPYSNAVRLKKTLEENNVPHKMITPIDFFCNNHMLGGECLTDHSPFVFSNQDWVKEAKEWMELYLK